MAKSSFPCRFSPSTLFVVLTMIFSSTLATGQQGVQIKPPLPLNPPPLPRTSPSSQPARQGMTAPSAIQSPAPALSRSTWSAIGPASLQTGGGLDSGRITAIAVDPTDSNTIYIAAAGGGVWKTTDGGTTWTALTDNQATLGMGSIAIAPTDHLKIYAGTGEANNSADSNYGHGILVSDDGGSTWSLATAGGAFDGVAIGQIAVDPTNENVAYAAVGGFTNNGDALSNEGIWKTTDGGNTWTNTTSNVIPLFSTELSWSAVVVDPNNNTIVYAAVGDIANGIFGNGVYRSMDGGNTWAQLANAPSAGATGRIALAVSPAAKTTGHHVLYVAVSRTVSNGGDGSLLYFGRSDNADAATPTFTDLTSGTPNFLGTQGWYDIVVNVDANGVVYCAGVENYSLGGTQNIIKSTNLGVNWTDISIVGGVEPHTDSHAIAFDSSNRMLIGNDGGIWRYDSTVPSWTDLNGNLNTIQFYGIGLHPTSATTVVGGSQDNGNELDSNNTVWTQTDGGDGAFAQFSQTDGTRCYADHPVASFGSADFFRRSDDGCQTWTSETSGFVNTNSDWTPPFVVDSTDGDHLLIGLDRVYESTNGATSWTPISTPGSAGFNNVVSSTTYNVDTVALSPANGTNPEVIYAATGGGSVVVGSNTFSASLIFVSTNDGSSWTEHNLPPCTSGGHYSAGCRVNQIVVDPSDPTGQTAIAVTNNFTGQSGGHVYRTTNAGASWTDISSGLPDLPTWSVQIDTDPSRTIYVSNDDAVYSSVSPYSTWTLYGTGLPKVQGLDLELNPSLHLLGLATHGRGAWEIETPPHVTDVNTTAANGTYFSGAAIHIVVTFSTAVNVTGTPQLTLDTAPTATATYSSGSGTTSLTFLYTVASGQTTKGNATNGVLDYTSGAALSLNGGMIVDGDGIPAVLTLYAPGAVGSLSASSSILISSLASAITPTLTVTPSSYNITTAQALSVTVGVSGGSGNPTPTGSVTLTGGSYSSGSTVLSGGSATINIPAGTLAAGSYTFQSTYTPDTNSAYTYSTANGTASSPVTVTGMSAAGLQFIPVTPCRVVDTRNPTGPFGGPEMSAGSTREFDLPQGGCNIPSTALAYSLNVTVVPNGPLGYLTLWPAGQAQPFVSTLNSDGRVKANAAIVPAGSNSGVDVYVTDATQLVLDIDGYFVPVGTSSALAFYPVTPCRVADTRNSSGPLGGPTLSGGTSRDFPVQASNCGIPATAQAYSLNVTAVPQSALDYLTLWPTGETQPFVSTLNSLTGEVVANAAIVPAGTGGDVSVYVTDNSDVVLDIDGYFAPPGTGGLSLYTVSPCRVEDTRNGAGAFSGVLTVNVDGSPCAPPSTAQGYVFNATVVPSGGLGYLTLWPNGETQPFVSTLNADDGTITSNMAIVPTTNGSINAYATQPTQLILDMSGYFAPTEANSASSATAPVFSPNTGSGTSESITISTATTACNSASYIRYTTDGTTPTSLSTAGTTVLLNQPGTYTLKAGVFGCPGYMDSAISTSGTYTVSAPPLFSSGFEADNLATDGFSGCGNAGCTQDPSTYVTPPSPGSLSLGNYSQQFVEPTLNHYSDLAHEISPVITSGTLYGRFYIYLGANCSGSSFWLASVLSDNATWDTSMYIMSRPDNQLEIDVITTSNSSIHTTIPGGLAMAHWYRVEFSAPVSTSPTATVEMKVFDGDSTTPLSGGDVSLANMVTVYSGGTGHGEFDIGALAVQALCSSNSPATVTMDNVALSTTGWIGPQQ